MVVSLARVFYLGARVFFVVCDLLCVPYLNSPFKTNKSTRNLSVHSAQKIGFDTLQQRSLESSPHQSLEFPTSLLSMASGSGRAGTESNPLSLSGELNLTSLSSDSGVHTGKASEMSNSGEADIVNGGNGGSVGRAASSGSGSCKRDSFGSVASSSDKSEPICGDPEPEEATAAAAAASTAEATPGSKLTRNNSVRARANMFQALEQQRQDQLPARSEERPVRKCEYTQSVC